MLHPPQTDEQQIIARLEAMSGAARAMSARGVVAPMTEAFRWQGMNKREINSQLSLFFFNAHTVEVKLLDIAVEVNAERATTEGAYHLTYRMAPDAPPESRLGRFRTRWLKRDGEWKLDVANGGENLAR